MAKFVEVWLSTKKRPDAANHPAVLFWHGMFALTFLLARNVFGYYWSFKYIRHSYVEGFPVCAHAAIHILVLTMNVVFNVLNTFWASKIVSRLVKVALGTKSKKKPPAHRAQRELKDDPRAAHRAISNRPDFSRSPCGQAVPSCLTNKSCVSIKFAYYIAESVFEHHCFGNLE
eukprot:1774852-Pyramimonas_sp.AAC.1